MQAKLNSNPFFILITLRYCHQFYDEGATWEDLGQATGDKGESGAAGETMPDESVHLSNDRTREFIYFYSNWWPELTKIYGDVFSMEFNIPTEAQLERAMGTGACNCVNTIASDWFYYPLNRDEDKKDPIGWNRSWFGYGKVHKSNELQYCLDHQMRTGITLRLSSINRADRYKTKGDKGNVHLVIYDTDLNI